MMRAHRRLRKMATKAEDKQRRASQVLRSQGKQDEVLTSSHEGPVLFNFCNLIEYKISHEFQIYEIHVILEISHAFYIHEI